MMNDMADTDRAGEASVDPRILARIRAMLAKAEATTFPAEAEAFTAKAQRMMSDHSIEQALLEGDAISAQPGDLLVVHKAPYASQKASVLSSIARPNRCRCVWNSYLSASTVFGFEHDLAAVELLFTSLLVQANSEMSAAEAVGRFEAGRIRSFRASFYLGYGSRVGQRLSAIRDEAARDAAEVRGVDILPVLASRDGLVEDAMHETFPNLSTRRVSLSNGHGYRAGRVAGDRADLGPGGARLGRAV